MAFVSGLKTSRASGGQGIFVPVGGSTRDKRPNPFIPVGNINPDKRPLHMIVQKRVILY